MSVPGISVSRADRDSPLDEIATEIERRTGLGKWSSRGSFLADKVRQRTNALGLSTETDYFDRLLIRGDTAEWDTLIEAITIGETSFWRYAAQWQALRDIVLPHFGARQGGERIRVWCAGCSNGAEPYTLSILLHHETPEGIDADRVEILATDISEARLAQAMRGLYSNWDLRGLATSLRDACFLAEGSRWRLRDEYKRGIEFRQHNLADFADDTDPAERDGFDLIMCRNVLIYFDADLMRRVLRQFHNCAADGGWFLSGHAESYLEIANVFVPVAAPGTTLYRKHAVMRVNGASARRVPAAPPPKLPGAAPPTRGPSIAPSRPARRQRAAPVSARLSDHEIPTLRQATAPEPGIETLRSLANRGAWREAAALGGRIAECDGFDPEVHFLISLSCAHMGDPQGAEAALRRALYLDPDFALAHYHLGMVATSRQRPDEAARCFRNVLASLNEVDDEEVVRAGAGVTAGDLRQYAGLQLGQRSEVWK